MPLRNEHIHFSLPEAEIPKAVAWYAKTLIWLPTGRLALVMPLRRRLVGGPPSIPHVVTLPSVPFTSIQIQAWGLTSSTLLTVPCRLTGLFSSNAAAKEWCALTGTAASSRPSATTTPRTLTVIRIWCSFLNSSVYVLPAD